MGGRSATPLAPTWRASVGELPLLLKLTQPMVRDNGFTSFSPLTFEPHPSRYNNAILKKFFIFLRKLEPFLLQPGCSKGEEHFHSVGSLTKAGWKLSRSGNGLWHSRNGLRLAHQCSPGKGHHPPLQDVQQG